MAWTLQGSDDFTDTPLTAIGSHTPSPSGGFTWSVIASVSGGATVRINIDGDKFQSASATGGALASLTLDDTQKSEGKMTSGSIGLGILGNSAGDGYLFIARDGLSSFISRYDDGTPTNIATGGSNAAANDIISFETDGAGNLTGRINGVSALTTSDSTYTSGGAWLLVGASETADDFAAYDDAGGGSPVGAAQYAFAQQM